MLDAYTGPVILVGERGVGKTLLASKLLNEARDAGHVVFHVPVVQGEDNPIDAVAYRITHIKDSVELEAVGRAIILLVDDAHSLSTEAFGSLERIAGLEHKGDTLVRIVLVGRPSLKALLLNSDSPRLNCWRAVHLQERLVPSWVINRCESLRGARYYTPYRADGLLDFIVSCQVAAYRP